MGYAGGLRARLIKDSLYFMVYDALDQLNWFDPTLEDPVEFLPKSLELDEEILPIKVGLEDDDDNSFDAEMGSNLSEFRWRFYIDVFGHRDRPDDALHLATDIRDILQGRLSTIGRDAPVLDIYDYTQATPPVVFVCDIENVNRERVPFGTKPWLKAWYSISFTIVDSYADETD